jgi:DNA modification methylase/predicted DNA-binding protein
LKNEIIIGDCADVLKKFDSESIDCIVTDPPYGYSFMGLSWDKALPSLEALKECNRVLKSGAFGFFMCAPRMDVLWRMGQRLEEAGFRVDFSFIGWAFASGFPKAQNISKLVTKRLPDNKVLEVKYWLSEQVKRCGKTKSQINKECGFDACNYLKTEPGTDSAGRDTWHKVIPTGDKWGLMKKVVGFGNEYDELVNELAKVTGKRPAASERSVYGKYSGEIKDYDLAEHAKKLEGSFAGAQFKPALEVIIVCMKNLSEKTYVDQALQNGHGCTWLGDCKIPYSEHGDEWNKAGYPHRTTGYNNSSYKIDYERESMSNSEGRFPANLLVSDNILDRGIITKSNTRKVSKTEMSNDSYRNSSVYGKYGECVYDRGQNDSGDFSRYFSLDAWFDKKIQELPPEQQKTFPFLITPKPSKSEKNKYIENKHPTVKPLKLMSYLITMGSREGDLILDPFAGSGTTLEACKLLNRRFIGIDLDPENEKYMRARGQLESPTLEAFVK